jgi:hypothetical protein
MPAMMLKVGVPLSVTLKAGLILAGLLGGIRFAAAQTWTQANVPTNNYWGGIASSANGKKLVAVSHTGTAVYISTNSGASWTSNNVPNDTGNWSAVASSADGTKLAATQNYGGIYTSTNSGVTWQRTSASDNEWGPIASSADGTKLAVVSYWIDTSTNSGATWTRSSAPGGGWSAIASSSDGTQLAAAPYQGPIYVSTNSGVTWTQTGSPNTNWISVASSADGNTLAIYSYSLICTSTNAGATWLTRTNLPGNGRDGHAIASSADGTRLAAAAWTQLCTSTNSGASWQIDTQAPLLNSGYSVVCSADGTVVALAELGGPIYVRPTPPPIFTRLNISITNYLKQQERPTNSVYVALSWPSWATNAVVQQSSNSNLSGWATVTNLPTLTTNIQAQTTNYQVILPLAGSRGFYRLNSP